MHRRTIVISFLSLPVLLACATLADAAECDGWQQSHPDWLWCDSFESQANIDASYFDNDTAEGRMSVSTQAAVDGQSSLKATYVPGENFSGSIKLSLGRTPVSPKRYTDKDFTELYWRVYVRTGANWAGNPQKLTRGIVFARSDWSEAAIGHVWEDEGKLGLGVDPVSAVSGSTVLTTGYNDFDNFTWLGKRDATTQIYSPAYRGRWVCVETRMKLNTPGASDGQLSLWIDGKLEADATNLNFRGNYTAYGINAIFLENYVNDPFPASQDRYLDAFVVSTKPVGCGPTVGTRPNPPTNVKAN